MKPAGKAFDPKITRRIYGLAKPYGWLFSLAVFFTVLMAALGPLRAWLIQLGIDGPVATGDTEKLLSMTLLITGLLFFSGIIQFAQALMANYIGQHVIRRLRVRVFSHIMRYKLGKLDGTPVGTLTTRSVSDLETLADVFSEGLVSIVGDLMQIIFIMLLMFWQSWQLTLVCLSVLPLLLFAGWIFKNAVKASFTETRAQVTRLNTFVQEHIQGMQIVQVFNRQKSEYGKFESINRAHRDANNRGVFAYAVFFPVVEVIIAISTALIVWYGVGLAAEHPKEITLGLLTAFLMLISMFFRPIRQLADRFNTLQMGVVAAERLFELLDETTVLESSGSKIPAKLDGLVEFKNVTFAYNDDNYILNDISFSVKPGKTLAIVGPTGAGKSSIIGLLNRFYTQQKGTISIDGNPVDELDLHWLRTQVSLVMQDVYLFSGTVKDNLTLFDDSIPLAEVEEACKLAGLHGFISELQGGYNYPVNERGLSLSTGQRQLIAFVRAMLAKPQLLILDEATSSVDTESEQRIQTAIAYLMKGRTSIVIAHRLSTILHADEILVIDAGKIIEQGTHLELLQMKGSYYRLYEMQFDLITAVA